jgi:hypothetical protein
MKKQYFIPSLIIVIGLAVAFCMVWPPNFSSFLKLGPIANRQAPSESNVVPTPIPAKEAVAGPTHNDTTLLPHTAETYQIMQAADAMPKIVQTTIDPLGVHVGDTQKLSIIVQDPDPIVSVVAEIETDNGTTTLPLKLVGPAQLTEIVPQKYYVDASNHLALVKDGAAGTNVADAKASNEQGVALAATGGNEKYAGSWVVRGTHNTTYRTIFIVKDSTGHTNSITMAWSDACGIPNGGGANISGCSTGLGPSYTDGVENGNANITGGLVLNTTFIVNPSYSMNFSGGSVSVAVNNGQILFNQYICMLDGDGDGYYVGSATNDSSSNCSNTGRTRRYLEVGSGDCDNSDGRVYPGSGYWETSPSNGGTWDYNCDGNIAKAYNAGDSVSTQCGGNDCTGVYYGNTVSLLSFWGSVPNCGQSFTDGYGNCYPYGNPTTCNDGYFQGQDYTNDPISATQSCN